MRISDWSSDVCSSDLIKSTSRILLAWIEEAETVTEEAWVKLIPTLREEDSELWLTWNPERETSATNKRFRNSTDPRTKIVEMNWRDNPWFPDILNRQREKDKRSEEHTSELQSLMRISYAVFCLKKKKKIKKKRTKKYNPTKRTPLH